MCESGKIESTESTRMSQVRMNHVNNKCNNCENFICTEKNNDSDYNNVISGEREESRK